MWVVEVTNPLRDLVVFTRDGKETMIDLYDALKDDGVDVNDYAQEIDEVKEFMKEELEPEN